MPKTPPGRRSGQGSESAFEHVELDERSRRGAPPHAVRSRHTVLVVDDQDAKRYAIMRSLGAEGFLTAGTATGQEALTLAAGFSAIVLDVLLQDTDGFEVCRALRGSDQTRHLPIILFSDAFTSSGAVLEGTRAGADAFLRGTFNAAALAATLDRLIGDVEG